MIPPAVTHSMECHRFPMNTKFINGLRRPDRRKHWSEDRVVVVHFFSHLIHFLYSRSWLQGNLKLAHERSDSLSDLREDVEKLEESITRRLKLKTIKYDCGWNIEHYRGCLKSLERLVNMHENDMKQLEGNYLLKSVFGSPIKIDFLFSGRNLVFAPISGVSLEGDVMLFTGDVQRNWLDVRFVPRMSNECEAPFTLLFPVYQKHFQTRWLLEAHTVVWVGVVASSTRNSNRPPQVYAQGSSSPLRLTTNQSHHVHVGLFNISQISQILARHPQRLWNCHRIVPIFVSNHRTKWQKMFVFVLTEFSIRFSEAGPLMVSPTGQLIAPSTCPGSILVDFLTTHMDEATRKMEEYKT